MFRTVIFELAGEEKPLPVAHVSSVEHVRLLVAASFWKAPLPLSFVLKYRDEDGDLITLDSADDWREMLAHVAQPRVFILARATPTPLSSSSSSLATSAASTSTAAAPAAPLAVGAQVVPVGSRFRQRWVLRNTGAVAWPAGCRVMHQRGELLGCFPSFLVPSAAPGVAVSIEVNFTAPRSVGVYESFWLLVTPRGEPLGDIVRVLVSAVQPTSSPVFPGLRLGEVYNVFPGLPSDLAGKKAAAASPSSATNNLLAYALASTPAPASVVRDVLAPGARFSRRWTLRSATGVAWPEGVRARRTSGCHSFGFFDSFLVPALAPGAETTLDLSLVAPNVVGNLDATWELHRPDGSRILGVALHLHLSLQRSTPAVATTFSSSSSSLPSSPFSASKRNDRHPLLAQITSLSEAELDKLCNAFVNL